MRRLTAATHRSEALHGFAGKLGRDGMLGEWLVEEDESGGRGHVAPVQQVIHLRGNRLRPLLLQVVSSGQQLCGFRDGVEWNGVRAHQPSDLPGHHIQGTEPGQREERSDTSVYQCTCICISMC